MFIDCAKLEKILKTDYKTWGVKFGLTKKGMYILNGTGWIIEADNTRITKEFLGTVIKTCGLAPEKGEFMTYQKGHDPQFETERKPLLWDMAEDTKEALISPIKIMQNDNMMTVVKTPGGARLINDARLAMVNPDKCRDDENPPSTFAVHGDWLVSCNDEMAVGICFTSPVYKPELEVFFYKITYVELDDNERTSERIGNFTAIFHTLDGLQYSVDGAMEYDIEDVCWNPYIECHPTYKIAAEGMCTLKINGKTMTANVGQNLTIDTDRMIAYREDGTLNNTKVSGNYEDMYLQPGNNKIEFYGGNLKVIPNWRCL